MMTATSRRMACPSFAHVVAALVLLPMAAAAQQQPKPTLVPTRPTRAAKAAPVTLPAAGAPTPLTATDLDAFLDGIVPLQLQKADIAGAVVTVVKDGQVVFAKGYGFSDAARRTPVSVDATLFRIGSVSKTFTWAAVMQLVEQGKIDLNRDVNAYLDFEIPATFGKPVTMNHLMSHSAGFEEALEDLMVPGTDKLQPMKTWLPSHLPTQIYPPGTTPAYSNYGATLAGYIVERVSGQPFETYVQQHILTPLHLDRTSFAQPLPPTLAPLLSKGYRVASQPPKPFEAVETAPAGSVSASAANMSRYMMAYLEDAAPGGGQLMTPETRRLMFSRTLTPAPGMNAMAHGFYEESRNGHYIVGHGGDTQWFHSDMHLMPDDHVGFFVSYNSAGNGKLEPRGQLWRAFLDRYFPYSPPAVATTSTNLEHARALAGNYHASRQGKTTLASSFWMLSQGDVRVNPDSTLSSPATDEAGNPKRYREVAPWLFREVNGQDQLAFPVNYAGERVMVEDVPIAVGLPTPWYKARTLNLVLLGIALGVFLLTLLSWPVNAILRRHYAYGLALPAGCRWRRWLVRLGCFLALLFVVLWLQFLSGVQGDIARFNSGVHGTIRLLQLIALLGALGIVVAIVHAVRSWGDRAVWRWTAVWNTLVALAFACYLGFLFNWHLLTTNLRY
jgi:CubicO group peptidase (beta-lactamase class C family)